MEKLTWHQRQFLGDVCTSNWVVDEHGHVHTNGDVRIRDCPRMEQIPVQFSYARSIAVERCYSFKTLRGFPPGSVENMSLIDLPNLASWEFAPRAIDRLYVSNVPHKMRDWHLSINTICRLTYYTAKQPVGVLSLLRVEMVGSVLFSDNRVSEIMMGQLCNNKDIHECQEELIEAGLSAWAKL